MVVMDYQEFVDQFRQETARQMAEFERSLAVISHDITKAQPVPVPEVHASKSGAVRRHRGRAKGILRR